MGAMGLGQLMEEEQITILHPETHGMSFIPDIRVVKCLVVFLPESPYWMLITLRMIASLLNRTTAPLPVLILSRSPATWLWRTLRKQVKNFQCLSNVRRVSSDLPCSQLAMILQRGIEQCPLLRQQSFKEEQIKGKSLAGLTKKELDAMADFFHGSNVTLQAKIQGVSRKTLYSQRKSGLKKMVQFFPSLAIYLQS